MDKRKKEIEELLHRFANGATSPEEDEFLSAWFEAESQRGSWTWQNAQHRDKMQKYLYQRWAARVDRAHPLLPLRHRWRIALAAASVLCALGIALALYLSSNTDDTLRINEELADVAVPAGTDAAILVLADGRTVRLDELQGDALLADGNVKIKYLQDGTVAYDAGERTGSQQKASKEMNTLHTPKGGNFRLTLPDGTSVWMNAGSSLSYPLWFGSAERRVTLLGEAYFDVAHDAKRPFHVVSGAFDVQVLGTTFNIMAYRDEPGMAITLETGRVAVSHGNQALTLEPGEQAYADATTAAIQKRKVDLEDALAWKNGYFSFENQDITAIMNHIARWYNCDVDFQHGLSARKYSGRIARSRPLQDVLASLEALGEVRFETKGRRISVMK
ncbi:FecR family protein [Parapedobacter luteus]|uniref:FecR family protein n=1 Tax=Parapedobacter luteus TaxID=623280 RepID=A0A1T5A653_9SPHI|nr:FecR family protein [Parapedobacter luteus]SKB30375.1 FecR family protein [Parapedobacter luteus]